MLACLLAGCLPACFFPCQFARLPSCTTIGLLCGCIVALLAWLPTLCLPGLPCAVLAR